MPAVPPRHPAEVPERAQVRPRGGRGPLVPVRRPGHALPPRRGHRPGARARRAARGGGRTGQLRHRHRDRRGAAGRAHRRRRRGRAGLRDARAHRRRVRAGPRRRARRGLRRRPDRRDLALRFGATVVCAPEGLADAAREHGADVVLELSGSTRAVQAALEVVDTGGRVALIGSVSPAPEVRFEPSGFVKNLTTVVGCHNYRLDDLVEAVAFLGRTPFRDRLAGLVSDPYPLADIDAAVAAARRGTAARVAVHMEQP
ncbi:zinc-binding dehydrogenase [Pseudonocardia sp. DLS-67]